MKIVKVNVYLIQAGGLHPVLAEIVTDSGLRGVGEAAIAYGHGATAAAGMVKDLAENLLLGRDPFRIEEAWSEMYDHSFWAKGGGGAIVFAGISALETALWDIKGRALGVPVYELLGGAFRNEVRVYANGWNFRALAAEDFARAAERPLADGYDALKCYPLAVPREGGGIRHVTRRMVDRDFADLAFERVAALRRFVGPKVEIMLDLSGGLTADETIRLCRRWEDLDILFVEEPCDPADLGALEKIAAGIAIPIALGERLYTRFGFRPTLETGAADIVQPDIGNTGGIGEAKKIAAMAEAWGCGCSRISARAPSRPRRRCNWTPACPISSSRSCIRIGRTSTGRSWTRRRSGPCAAGGCRSRHGPASGSSWWRRKCGRSCGRSAGEGA